MNLIIGKDLTVDSRTIAEGCGIKHKNAVELLRDHLDAIECELGRVRFETAPTNSAVKGGDGQKVAYLTEDQATALVTMFRNTPVVVRFKVALAKAFGVAKRSIPRDEKELYRWAVRQVADRLLPSHEYGSQTKSGGIRLGLRRASYPAAPCRTKDAAIVAGLEGQMQLQLTS